MSKNKLVLVLFLLLALCQFSLSGQTYQINNQLLMWQIHRADDNIPGFLTDWVAYPGGTMLVVGSSTGTTVYTAAVGSSATSTRIFTDRDPDIATTGEFLLPRSLDNFNLLQPRLDKLYFLTYNHSLPLVLSSAWSFDYATAKKTRFYSIGDVIPVQLLNGNVVPGQIAVATIATDAKVPGVFALLVLKGAGGVPLAQSLFRVDVNPFLEVVPIPNSDVIDWRSQFSWDGSTLNYSTSINFQPAIVGITNGQRTVKHTLGQRVNGDSAMDLVGTTNVTSSLDPTTKDFVLSYLTGVNGQTVGRIVRYSGNSATVVRRTETLPAGYQIGQMQYGVFETFITATTSQGTVYGLWSLDGSFHPFSLNGLMPDGNTFPQLEVVNTPEGCGAEVFSNTWWDVGKPCVPNPPVSVPTGQPVTVSGGFLSAPGLVTTMTDQNGVQIAVISVTQTSLTFVAPVTAGTYTMTPKVGDVAGIPFSLKVAAPTQLPPPTISCAANFLDITPGNSVLATCTMTNTEYVNFNQEIGSSSGITGTVRVQLSPTTTTTYSATAVGPGGVTSTSFTINVHTAGLWVVAMTDGSYLQKQAIASGKMGILWGNLSTGNSGRNPLPDTVLANTKVQFSDGTLATLYYVDPGQINFAPPPTLTPGKYTLRIIDQGSGLSSQDFPITITTQ